MFKSLQDSGFAFSLLHLITRTSIVVSASSAGSYEPSIKARSSTYVGEIDVTDFPSCAVANCITSDQLVPSRLGCVEAELTTECLCNEAPTPLSCAPDGPSDDNNCWYDLEDWFAGVCTGKVALFSGYTVPECMRDCVTNYISDQGCHSKTRNCFCILSRKAIIQAATSCYSSNCLKKMKSSFSPTVWHDDICNLGAADFYDQQKYDKYAVKIRKIRTSVSVLAGFIFVILAGLGIIMFMDDEPRRGYIFITIACVVLVAAIVPIYTVL